MSQAYRVCVGEVECDSESESPLEILSDIRGVIPRIHKEFVAKGWKEKNNLLEKEIDGVKLELDLANRKFKAHISGEKKVFVNSREASHKDALKEGRDSLKKTLDTELMKRDQKILQEINEAITAGEEEALKEYAKTQGSIVEQQKDGGNFRLTIKV